MTGQATETAYTLTNDEKETARLWLYAHNGDEGGGLGGLWQMVEGIARAHAAQALRDAADRIAEFQKWYPTSVFPSLDEVLSDDPEWQPTTEQVAASAYRHAYGDLVPRNLRTWAGEAIDGPGCDNCGGWNCNCTEGPEPCAHDWTLRPESDTYECEFCGEER